MLGAVWPDVAFRSDGRPAAASQRRLVGSELAPPGGVEAGGLDHERANEGASEGRLRGNLVLAGDPSRVMRALGIGDANFIYHGSGGDDAPR